MNSDTRHGLAKTKQENFSPIGINEEETGMEVAEQAAFVAFETDGSLLSISAWTVTPDREGVCFHRIEMAWNYVFERYNVDEYTISHDLKDDGETLEFNSVHWQQYARHVTTHTIELRPRLDTYIEFFGAEVPELNDWISPETNFAKMGEKLRSKKTDDHSN